jgi:hypothetical protein
MDIKMLTLRYMHRTYPGALMKRPLMRKPPRELVKVRAMNIEDTSYYIGKSIILFTMFYCTLNWSFYRDLRKRMEDDDDKKK